MTKLSQKDITKKLAKYSDLPSLPQNIIRIKKVSENPRASAADLANCILSDHQLTSRVLRMANSVYYSSYSGRISTVTRAIVLMGFRAVHNIAISMSVYEVINRLSRGTKFNIISFWIKSLASGVIAKFLANHIKQKKLIEAAFIAGFMHDIGQPILAGAFPEEYEEVLKLKTNPQNIHKIEQVIVGMNHMTAGEIVSEKWNLPRELVEAISKHHRIGLTPEVKSSNIVVDLVYLADNLYNHVMGETSPLSKEYTKLIKKARNLIDISEESMVELLIECRQQISDIARDLEIDIERELANLDLAEIETSEFRKELENKEMQLSLLQNATDALMQAKSNDEILQVICEAIIRGLQMGRVILFEYDSKWESFLGLLGFGIESQQAVQQLNFSAKKGFFRYLHETGAPVSVGGINDKAGQSLISQEEKDRLETEAFVIIPIKILDQVKYLIFIDTPDSLSVIDDEAFRSIVSLTKQASLTLERNLFKEKLNQK